MKKALGIILTLTMVLGMFVGIELPVFAATSGTTGDCTWTLDGTKLTISGNGKTGDYLIKDQAPWGTEITEVVIKSGVTNIGTFTFYNCSNLKRITIPNSMTSIGWGAFWGCSDLKNITIPNSVTNIDNYAFYKCTNLTSFTIPDNVTRIGEGTFECCINLTSITIPNGVTRIENFAFVGCIGLTSITIPDSVTKINADAFNSCTNLADIWYTGGKTDKQEIYIGSRNAALNKATWHYYCNGLIVGEDIETANGKINIPAISGYFTDKNGKLYFPGEVIEATSGDVFTPAPIEVAADNAFSVHKDYSGIRARGALSKDTVKAASEIGFVIVPKIAPDLSADWYVSSQYTYKQPVNKNAIYGAADEIDGYQYQLYLWDLGDVSDEDFLFAMYATVDGVTTYTYVGCASYELVNNVLSK